MQGELCADIQMLAEKMPPPKGSHHVRSDECVLRENVCDANA